MQCRNDNKGVSHRHLEPGKQAKSVPMDKLAPKLIRRAAKKNYLAIVIDPIYKVNDQTIYSNKWSHPFYELGLLFVPNIQNQNVI